MVLGLRKTRGACACAKPWYIAIYLSLCVRERRVAFTEGAIGGGGGTQGDALFHCGSRFGAQWLSSSQPVFLYSYTPAATLRPGLQDSIGHCSESGFIYLTKPQEGPVTNLEAAMGQYWYSFAKYGEPNTGRLAGAPVWPQYTNGTDMNIAFDVPIRTETGLRKEYCDVCAGTTTCLSHSRACV